MVELGRAVRPVGVFEQDLQGGSDRADERSGDGGGGDLVERVGERLEEVARDLALCLELELQRAATHGRNGADQPQAQLGETAGHLVAARVTGSADRLQGTQQHVGRPVPPTAPGNGLDRGLDPSVAFREE